MSDKCGLLYADIKNIRITDTNYHKAFKGLLQGFIIYQSKSNDGEYYFGDEHKYYKNLQVFGFYLTFINIPYFYEYSNGLIQSCDNVQLEGIDKSLKRFKQSVLGKSFRKHSELWGYTINRKKLKKREVVLKFVLPSTKEAMYPPGPGNVCVENNLGSKMADMKSLVKHYYTELDELIGQELLNNKKNLCVVIELVLRFKEDFTFYPLDHMWLWQFLSPN